MDMNWEDVAIDWDIWSTRMRRIYELACQNASEGHFRSVMDLGAGQMFLKRLLPENVAYYPVDGTARCKDTAVCNFNQKQFPELRADVIVAAGILNFVSDVEWFLKKVFESCQDVFILADTPTEIEGDIPKQQEVCLWKNYSYVELYSAIIKSGFLPVHIEKGAYENQVESVLFVLKKRKPVILTELFSCNGCGVCAEICPTAALKMEYDEEGFLRPTFDAQQCIECQKCLNHCSAIHIQTSNEKNPDSYAVWASEEIREQSSSGGMFSLLAENVLAEGGFVCGARYQPKHSAVKHEVISSVSSLPALRGSKYVQSDIRSTYAQIRNLLEEQAGPVLFVGCPCQVAALNVYLEKEYEQLYTVDLLCSGVTAPQVFQKYLEETYDVSQMSNVNFRTKQFGWSSLYLTVSFVDGTKKIVHRDADAFEQLFHSFAGLRPSCYICNFATFPRQGDLTLGDFWGIQNYDAQLDDQKGTSFVSINSTKGEKLFQAVQEKAVQSQPVPWQYTGTNRLFPFLSERYKMPATRDYFYHLLRKGCSVQESVNRALNQTYDVGVVCNWSGDNYGAQITQHAFYHVLTEMGLQALMIERPYMPYQGGNANTAKWFRENPYPSYAMCQLYDSLNQMRDINRYADTFIVPSDQLWNALFAEKDLFALGYIANNKKKISYATSFGCYPDNWGEDERAREAFFLQQFDAISVREDSAVRILQESFGIDGVEQTLDPVFLCDDEFYNRLCEKSAYQNEHGYIAAFVLDPSREKEHFIRRACQRRGLRSIQICDAFDLENKETQWELPIEHNIYAEDLLAVIKHSELVITDSFHGVCFSIIFKKPFIAIGNAKRGLARFESLLKLLHLTDRLVLDTVAVDDNLFANSVDYTTVDSRLDAERHKSIAWLERALNSKKLKPLTAYDILDEKAYQQEKVLELLRDSLQASVTNLDGHVGLIDTELLRINATTDAINAELLRGNQATDAINGELLRVNAATDAINGELLRVNTATDAINGELLRMNAATDAVNGELLRMNATTDAMNGELLRMNATTDAMNGELLRMNAMTDAMNGELLQMSDTNSTTEEKLSKLNDTVGELQQALTISERRSKELETRMQDLTGNLDVRIAQLENSKSYKLGRAITWLPRKIKKVFGRFF